VSNFVAKQDGTVPLSTNRAGQRISYEHLITSLPVGTRVDLLLQRKGEDLNVEIATVPAQFLVPRTDGHDCNPSYGPILLLHLADYSRV
jgi:hypothetical protein